MVGPSGHCRRGGVGDADQDNLKKILFAPHLRLVVHARVCGRLTETSRFGSRVAARAGVSGIGTNKRCAKLVSQQV